MTTTQTAFLNRIGILTPRQVRQQEFESWLRTKVKNIYVADNDKMDRAIQSIE